MRRVLATFACLAVVAAAGCGDSGISEEDLAQAEHAAYVKGTQAGYADGVKEARGAASADAAQRRADAREALADAREAAFRNGVEYVLHDLQVEPGQDYAIAFAEGRRGLFVRDSLPMKPGKTYECPPQTPYCNVGDTGAGIPAATAEPAPQDPCHPGYPNVCLDPSASDYDCAGSGGDGPEFVEGPVRILGSDPYDLDGQRRDGIGCEKR
jgi:hypothetical protein